MGQQPGLDGLRALSVTAVILYHAGFDWMHGGFLGVEVFFVVSGFLITTLLIEEREKSGTNSLSKFWMRRARRLLPALFTVVGVVAAWVASFGSAEQASQMRRDLPWSMFYFANWGTIVGDVPYFQPGDPPLLRHLWSLAVEEQWYLAWPVVFLALAATGRTPGRLARWLLGAVVTIWVLIWWVSRGGQSALDGFFGIFDGDNRIDFMYLSTITRATGLLLGAAAAFVWRPWRSEAAGRVSSRPLDIAMGLSVGVLVCGFMAAQLTEGYMYPWLMGLTSVASLVAVVVVVHPGATGAKYVFSLAPLVALGQRSYGLYLWHWPVLVVFGATHGSPTRFVVAMLVALAVSEVCFRFIEVPVRRGAIGRWWANRAERRLLPIGIASGVCGVLIVVLAMFYASVESFDVAAGGEATFELAPTLTTQPATTEVSTVATPTLISASPVVEPTTTPVVQVPTTPPLLPRIVAILGDSQAHSLAINLPTGIESTFTITDGSLSGCSIHEVGRVRSSRDGFSRDFSNCTGWLDDWHSAAEGADVALIVIGAWDVLDIEVGGVTYAFGSIEFDRLFTAQLHQGIAAAAASGAKVALLEVACMRPKDVSGAGVPALPERGDDVRVAHLNSLLRVIASTDSTPVTFVEGPTEWCNDPVISADLGYRWDGVHVYKPGANLIYETIAAALLAIPVTRPG